MAPQMISHGGFGQLATVTQGSQLAQEVQATYGGSVPITTVHDNKVTDYFHSSQHSHLLHADNINKFKDKGTVVGVYDISRDELVHQWCRSTVNQWCRRSSLTLRRHPSQ